VGGIDFDFAAERVGHGETSCNARSLLATPSRCDAPSLIVRGVEPTGPARISISTCGRRTRLGHGAVWCSQSRRLTK